MLPLPFTPTHVVTDADTGVILGLAANLECLTQQEDLFASVFWFGSNTVCFQSVAEWTLLPISKADTAVMEEVASYLTSA
jgi:hypothetical protein